MIPGQGGQAGGPSQAEQSEASLTSKLGKREEEDNHRVGDRQRPQPRQEAAQHVGKDAGKEEHLERAQSTGRKRDK